MSPPDCQGAWALAYIYLVQHALIACSLRHHNRWGVGSGAPEGVLPDLAAPVLPPPVTACRCSDTSLVDMVMRVFRAATVRRMTLSGKVRARAYSPQHELLQAGLGCRNPKLGSCACPADSAHIEALQTCSEDRHWSGPHLHSRQHAWWQQQEEDHPLAVHQALSEDDGGSAPELLHLLLLLL